MKQKLIIFLGLTLLAGSLQAQSPVLVEDELAVVYYMPKTQVAITVEYDQVQVAPGPFYQYAQRYLNTDNVVLEAQTYYELTNMHIQTQAVADHERAYKVHAQRDIEAQLLTLTAEGLLYGYNVGPATIVPQAKEDKTIAKPMEEVLMPLLEEQMIASSIAKMAEGAARQIYHIREMRLNILTGDVEHVPADGQAMQLVLNELNQREQALTELFVGRKQVTHLSKTIYYTPSDAPHPAMIARFSKFGGVVDAEDLSGEPIHMNVVATKQSLHSNHAVEDKKALQPSEIYYNLPGQAAITITYKDITITACWPVAQYGVAIPLAKDLFIKHKPTIYFNTQTGNITSIQK
jgi:hypothetical protein